MSLNLSVIGKEFSSAEEGSWTSTDTLLYALGVGAGSEDPTSESAFTTENSHDTPQQVLLDARALLAPHLSWASIADQRLGRWRPCALPDQE